MTGGQPSVDRDMITYMDKNVIGTADGSAEGPAAAARTGLACSRSNRAVSSTDPLLSTTSIESPAPSGTPPSPGVAQVSTALVGADAWDELQQRAAYVDGLLYP